MSETVLEGRKVSKYFGGLAAVADVDFKLAKGEILGLIGPNGAGKTTLVNVITGTHNASQGDVYYKGKKITNTKPFRIGRLGIARTFQIVKPFQNMTVLENAAVGAMFGTASRKLGARGALHEAEELLDFVGLLKFKNQPAENLNVPNRKRLEMAKALAMHPDVILFDEVMAGLNHSEIDEAVELIKKIRERGISILVIEHVMRAIKGVCDKVFVIHHGEKIAEGTPDQVLNDDHVIEAYLGRRFKKDKSAEH